MMPVDLLAPDRSLAGRVVVVTGASAGIGRAVAHRLATRGATVVAVARDGDRLGELATESLAAATEAATAAQPPGHVVAVTADLTDDAQRRDLVERVLLEQGRIDVLVNNLGVGWAGRVVDMELSTVRDLFETNVIAAIDLTLLVLPHLLDRGDGDLVFMASVASWFATPPLSVYAATKSALEGFADGLRREVATDGIGVHTVHPGPVATEFAARAAGEDPGELDGPVQELGPGVHPERVAAAVERVLVRPGQHSVAVPRVLGIARLVNATPLRRVVDFAVAAGGDQLAGLGQRIAGRAAGPSAR